MLRSENVAMPLAAATRSVPDSVPAAAFVPSATVIALLNVVTTFPEASSAATSTDDSTPPAWIDGSGCRANPRWVTVGGGGGGAITSIGVLVAAAAPAALTRSVNCPARSIVRSLNVATPLTATTLRVPDRLAPLGFARATGPAPAKPVRRWPAQSTWASPPGATGPPALG